MGLAAFYLVVSYTADLVVWFGPEGLLPVEVVRQLTGVSRAGPFEAQPAAVRWSFLFLADSKGLLWCAHGVSLLVTLAFALGLFSRVTAVLSLAVVLSYVHRAPMITGPFESVLTMLLFYLCWAPCGARWSVDRWLAERKSPDAQSREVTLSIGANISQRLMQVHLSALYLLMGMSMLAGEVWWAGEAVWWLVARGESRLIDLTFLDRHLLVINLWTHAVVLFPLAFGVFIWNSLARPLLLVLSLLLWVPLALVTGLVSYCGLMLIAGLCFLPAKQEPA